MINFVSHKNDIVLLVFHVRGAKSDCGHLQHLLN